MSAYQGALDHIERHPGTGSAQRLAKLLLSLWNGEDCGFSFRECIEGLDDERRHIALGCVTTFAKFGETDELVRIGYRVHALCPRTWELGIAAREAKAALRAKWEAEWEAKCAREEREADARQREREQDELVREWEEHDRDCGDAAEWDSPGVRR